MITDQIPGTSVTFENNEISLHFSGFGIPSYELFLKAKRLPEYRIAFHPDQENYTITAPARFAEMLGIERPPLGFGWLPLSPFLFDDQRVIVNLALDAKRFACWSGCGLGKSLIELEFARQVCHRTKGRVLLVTFNEIVHSILAEAKHFYPEIPVLRIVNQVEMIEWCRAGSPGIAITNYEKFNPTRLKDGVINELRHLSGFILDESSRLKGGGNSKQKKVIIASAKGIEYKLSCTATPAPNETIEFVSQANFLEKVRSETDIIWTYFTRDNITHRRSVKPHARIAFFDFMASWSVYLKNPKRFGWRLDHPDVPEPTYHVHELSATQEQRDLAASVVGGMFGTWIMDRETNAIERVKLAQIARGFLYSRKDGKRAIRRFVSAKPPFSADLAKMEMRNGRQTLIWSVFDEETVILNELLADSGFRVDVLTGKTKEKERVKILERFHDGESRCLISRPKMLGYGMNFQCCKAMVFSGFSESFEDLYQAIHRAVRHGQTESVQVHFPVVSDLEGDTFANLRRKADENERATSEMEDNYLKSYQELKLRVAN